MDLSRKLGGVAEGLCVVTVPPKDLAEFPKDVEPADETVVLDPIAALGSVSEGSSDDNDSLVDMSDCEESENLTNRISDCEESENLTNRLSNWALTYGISHVALTALLVILTVYHSDLPRDARTLLRTKTVYSVKTIRNGLYYYFGIVEALGKSLSQWKDNLVDGCCLQLQINIDGLPLFKSSSIQLWPILGLLVSVPMKEPVVIGLFSGQMKPMSTELLTDFVCELSQLQEGFNFEGKRFKMRLHSIICDTPARSFVKNTKAFNGYHGCDKCTHNGVYLNNRMTYPLQNNTLRTDASFSDQLDEDHHLGPHPFMGLDVGMVSQVPLDYMHLVCLGVVRRLIHLWLKGPLTARLPSRDVNKISDELVNMRSYIPKEFARKPRSLKEVDRWKATEYRQFLLYTGQVVLRDVLSDTIYSNFLLLSTAVSILVSPSLSSTHSDYANSLLHSFVGHFSDIYGRDQVVYNVHGLTHLAQDAKNFGSLDNISAFPFENFLGKLKRFVRKPSDPLAQIIRRISEESSCHQEPKNVPQFRKEHCRGPVPVGMMVCHQYDEIKMDKFTVSTKSSDNTFLICGNVCSIQNIIQCQDDIYIAYKQYKATNPFFTYPMNSRFLHIVTSSVIDSEIRFTKIVNISQKCLALPYRGTTVFIPLFHTKD